MVLFRAPWPREATQATVKASDSVSLTRASFGDSSVLMTMVRGLIWWCGGGTKTSKRKNETLVLVWGVIPACGVERSGTYALGLKVPAHALEEELAGSLALFVSLLLDLLNFN